jgi:hypothetical protein
MIAYLIQLMIELYFAAFYYPHDGDGGGCPVNP